MIQEKSGIKVAIVGLGDLGWRTAQAIKRQPDMHLSAAAGKNHPRDPIRRSLPPEHPHAVITFDGEPLPPDRLVDVVVDGTPPGTFSMKDFSSPIVIFQANHSRKLPILCAPVIPIQTESTTQQVVRIADCNSSAATPILAALGDLITDATYLVSMRQPSFPTTKPTAPNVTATRLVSGESLEEDLQKLFPTIHIEVEDIEQQLGKLLYLNRLTISTAGKASRGDIIERLDASRITLLDNVHSTDSVGHIREIYRAGGEHDISPIVVLKDEIKQRRRDNQRFTIPIVVNPGLITPLAIIDAIRILATGIGPHEAMAITDQSMKLIKET